MNAALEAPIWVLNGMLVLLYVAVDQWVFLVLAGLCAFILQRAPGEQRPRTIGALGLALAAGLLAPTPVPTFLLTIAGAAILMPHIEHYNRPAIQWQGVGAMGLYALIGLGVGLWRSLRLGEALASDPLMTQGSNYLNVIIGIALYIFPLGFLAWSAKSIWAHPPAPGSPDQIIRAVRTRGK
ncbi:MAG: hypothetical protein NT121_24640 [Chloroflexi bacterium]|nr:hypothetical protein [Chloroflexota bacterium]